MDENSLVIWSDLLMRGMQIVTILILAWTAQRYLLRGLSKLNRRYTFAPELLLPLGVVLRWLIIGTALITILERLGVSVHVLWTVVTGFAAVAAVAFFPIWSVLSNLFCAILIFTVGPFRLGDLIEVIDSADKPGVKGRVVNINMLYTTLEETSEDGSSGHIFIQIPNSSFFQKTTRRWRDTGFIRRS
jgi:small-conductance mechanosensitive channel